jgi:predicted esterase
MKKRVCFSLALGIGMTYCLAAVHGAEPPNNPDTQLPIASDKKIEQNDEPAKLAVEMPPFLKTKLVAMFEKGQFPFDAKEGQPQIEYRLFKPNVVPTKKYPLIIWLHGIGTDETTFRNVGQLKHLDTTIFKYLESRDPYPFYLLAPQLPYPYPSWVTVVNAAQNTVLLPKNETAFVQNATGFVPYDFLEKIIDQLLAQNPIDPENICIVGISSGATDAWEITRRNPQRYATLVSLASFRDSLSDLDQLKNLSVWSFHAKEDRPEAAELLISKLNDAGGWGYFTVTPGHPLDIHDCWNDAFKQQYGLLPWILNQKRGVHRPKNFFGDYWPQLVIAGISLICVLAIRQENRRKRRAKSSQSETSNTSTNDNSIAPENLGK